MIPTIEIININDKQASDSITEPFSPTEEQVVEQIQQLFKYDPLNQYLSINKLLSLLKELNQYWVLTEKKLKLIMKNNNLNNQLQQDQYLDRIEYPNLIELNYDLPKNLFLKFNNLKGNSLHTSNPIDENKPVFSELKPIFFIPQLDHLNLIKSSKACSYCGSLLSCKKDLILNNLDCVNCNEIWCSSSCKNDDKLHHLLKHENLKSSSSSSMINYKNFNEYLKFCSDNGNLQDFYAIAIVKCYFLLDTSFKEIFFNNFSKINESIRYKINHPNSLIENDEIYLNGFKLFNDIFSNNGITFDEFTLMLGIYNLNNYQGSIFKFQSILNHNCDNNVKIELINNKLSSGIKIFTTKKILKNDELVFNYINSNELNNRLKFLRINYGFICHCSKCQIENKFLERRKSSNNQQHLNTLKEFKNLIKNNSISEFELPGIDQFDTEHTERRKSVRFNDKVIAVNDN